MFRLSVIRRVHLVRGYFDHRLSLSGRRREDGAIAALVAILMGTGVILGAAALTIDTGALLYERSQLQNGADAVALSIAKTCAGPTPCAAPDITSTDPLSLSVLAGANAADKKSTIASVCGSAALVAVNNAFTLCPAPSPGLVECPNTTSAAKYVEVRTETLNGDGSSILPPVFAQMLSGAGTQFSHTTVKACGRAGWGPARTTRGFVLPVAMSYCEWKAATGADPTASPPVAGTYVTQPDYTGGVAYGYDTDSGTSAPPWPTATEKEVYTASSVPAAGCTTWNGHMSPGNFSVVARVASTCSAVAGEWMVGNTGNDSPCADAQLAPYRGKTILVPLFDCVAASRAALTPTTNCSDGGNTNYHITGYATFYLTGWQFSGTGGVYDNSVKDNHQLCWGAGTTGSSGRCFSGWFTRQVIGVGEIDDTGAPDFGTTVIQVLG